MWNAGLALMGLGLSRRAIGRRTPCPKAVGQETGAAPPTLV